MFEAFSYIWAYMVQTIGLFIAFGCAAVFIYLALRRSHSRGMTLAFVLLFVSVSLFFYVPNGLPSALQYPFYSKTYGPSTGPVLPFSHVLDFFRHFSRFERVDNIARDPNDLPPRITRTEATTDTIDLTVKEIISQIAPGVYFNYWTFNGKVPGPFLRVMEGDTVKLTLHNDPTSLHPHSIDLHAVLGPGGGAAVTSVNPGEMKTLTFKAMRPGLYVYHCAYPNAANHMAHGMYGLILVEPKGGLPKVDKEFYVMQGELYTAGALGRPGLQIDDTNAMLNGTPQYIVFNGKVKALPGNNMQAHVGETVRLFVGNGGVNLASAFHVIGGIFDRLYDQGSIMAPPLQNVQTTMVAPGGATMAEMQLLEPGNFVLVDHALARLDRGAWGILHVDGEQDKSIYNGTTSPMSGH